MKRRQTQKIKIGNLFIGGDAPILIQSMTNTKTSDVEKTVQQILELEQAGCEIVRVTVNDKEAAKAIREIKKRIHIPLVADIHFDYKLALMAIENGIDKLRINPGNIGSVDRIEAVVNAAKEKSIPIRIGVNGGSLEQDILDSYGVTAEGLYQSALKHIRILESFDFYNTIVSIKASRIQMTLEAFEMLADEVDYPFHIGITEAGTKFKGTIKSSIGIGALLLKGLGDTLRVSLTADPVEEIPVCKEILNTLGLRTFGIKFISCPTCGRTQTAMIDIAEAVEKAVSHLNKELTVAIMGCAVNGPGEAKEADLGVACGDKTGLIFKKGEILKKVDENAIVSTLVQMIEEY
ncbi:MAG: flavodoxin-dependent (E)-4-hydroxy-3-methylbut-2-enyl-diphosphate synthase [Clostridiales bacterium]|nr:flavodoxin-dependent (E)-4-hydroxy-3-methylbut-2-enyl-diphosphate synthase [Clostridiales bacterium]